MALVLQLHDLTVPEGTEFPGNVQSLLQLIEEYMEITGGENFSGVNYGSTEPLAADRDKAWLRIDGTGDFLGWHIWNGSAWVLLPSKAHVGTYTERDALSPQEGEIFHVVGTGLYTYVEGDGWQPAVPAAAEPIVYDRHYFFNSHKLLAHATNTVSAWTQVPLSSYITEASLTTIKAAMIRIEAGFGPVGFGGPQYFEVKVRVDGNTLNSTSALDVLNCSATGTRDDSNTSAQNANFGFVQTSSSSIYYNVEIIGSPANAFAKVWLTGFIY